MGLKILHQDENFIVVDKEYDIVINSNDPQRHSLHQQLVEKFPGKVNSNLKFGFYFPHRLDYSTSGVMCIALSKTSCAAAGSAFQNSLVEKYYLAILRGHVSKKAITINMDIGEGSLYVAANIVRELTTISATIFLTADFYIYFSGYNLNNDDMGHLDLDQPRPVAFVRGGPFFAEEWVVEQ